MPDLPLLGSSVLWSLAGALHCAGMCGPFALLIRGSWLWHAGRLLAYSALGAAMGMMGERLQLSELPLWVRAIPPALAALGLAVGAASLLGWTAVGSARWLALPSARLRSFASRGPRPLALLGLGASAALLPCGLLWGGLGLAGNANSPLGGALLMLVFGIGTLPGLVGLVLGGRVLGRLKPARWVRTAAILVAFAAGMGVIALRDPLGQEAPSCHEGM